MRHRNQPRDTHKNTHDEYTSQPHTTATPPPATTSHHQPPQQYSHMTRYAAHTCSTQSQQQPEARTCKCEHERDGADARPRFVVDVPIDSAKEQAEVTSGEHNTDLCLAEASGLPQCIGIQRHGICARHNQTGGSMRARTGELTSVAGRTEPPSITAHRTCTCVAYRGCKRRAPSTNRCLASPICRTASCFAAEASKPTRSTSFHRVLTYIQPTSG